VSYDERCVTTGQLEDAIEAAGYTVAG
jgi:copper chaperone CopZ